MFLISLIAIVITAVGSLAVQGLNALDGMVS